MELGQFSVSLAVKNMDASLEFYSHFGFQVIDGGHVNEGFPDKGNNKWRILQNSSATIGLFQGMFDSNIITFNPKDVRGVQKELKAAGLGLLKEADGDTEGPASIMLQDPDGNTLLLDQHH